MFCKVVAVAEAQVRRDGQVRAKGSPVHHRRWDRWRQRPGRVLSARSPGGRRWVPGS
ncbi:MAG: hypothetical protein JO345_22160 [Streptosporangiaceae bacterium]|nr:hypothetical protein [Streptosporangiaceae bacterium]